MTGENKAEIIKYKLSRANDTLDEVEFLIKSNYLNTAVNRLYYACYYAVSALLISNDINAKKHSGVIQMFNLHFISTGIIDRTLGKFYSEIFDLRQNSDYENFIEFEPEEVTELLLPARKLIIEIQQILPKKKPNGKT